MERESTCPNLETELEKGIAYLSSIATGSGSSSVPPSFYW